MRIFSIVAAIFAFVAALVSVAIVSSLERVYSEMGVMLPSLAQVYLNSLGLVPGVLFFLLGLVISLLLVVKRLKSAAIVSGVSLVIIFLVVGVMSLVFLAPMTNTL